MAPVPVRTRPQREAAHFDRLIEAEGDFNPFADRGWQTLARRYEKATVGLGRGRVLDVGCGTGQSQRIYESGASQYVGLDVSLEALRTAASRRPDAGWLQGDALHLPFPNRSFEVVAFSSVLHHLADRTSALIEARRVLVPGGLVFAYDPNLLHPAMLLFRWPRSPLYRSEGVSPDEQPLLPHQLRLALAAAGFERVGQRCQSDIPYRHVGVGVLNRLLPAYNALDWVWERCGAGRWMGSFVVTWARTPVLTSTRPAAATP
jgi:SAM-dependent methyltransferase